MTTPTSFPRAMPFLRPALTSLLAFLFMSVAPAQTNAGRITGIVTNSSGNAFLEGATVTIDGSNRMTTTDRRGEFDFGGIPPGDYSLRVAYTGMAPASIRAVVTAGLTASVTVTLGENVLIMGPFPVTPNRNADPTYRNSHLDANRHADPYTHPNGHAAPDCHADRNAASHRNADGNATSHRNADRDPAGDPDAVEPSVGEGRPGEVPGFEGALVGTETEPFEQTFVMRRATGGRWLNVAVLPPGAGS